MAEMFLDWNPTRVAQYFSSELGENVRASFVSNNIDGSLLPFLTTGHLRELGIESLAARLRVKRKLNQLLAAHYTDAGASTAADSHLRAIDINSNYVSMEALNLCSALLHDMSLSSRRVSDDASDVDLKKLNENYRKLRSDLLPVLRLVKDSKPLPTPTLDPALNANTVNSAAASSPTHSVHSALSASSWSPLDSDGGHTPTTATTLVLPGTSPHPHTHTHSPGPTASPPISRSASSASAYAKTRTTSPTQSHRFSSGSLFSVGVGKITEMTPGSASRFPAKPRLVDAASASLEDVQQGATTGSTAGSTVVTRPVATRNKPSSTSVTSSTPPAPGSSGNSGSSGSQPLKQLKASSDDTCLKVLQHAMKRHHIPREKWSKYVLVVCYGDKERILKLTEKPVLIFKELQEHGQNPAIMLRERAPSAENENERDYADARIGADIPGGVL